MKKRSLSCFLPLLFVLVQFPPLHAQTREKGFSPKDLEPKYKQWVEEEVVYIITKKERDIFLVLQTNRERDIFIEAFWKQRDPTPNTPANEFRTEHYRRIKYANTHFGKDSPQPGWKSEMGRIFIILGEPKQIERYENESDLYPIQVWFYEGMVEYGLPSAFYVVFFRKYNAGDYILYSPIRDGPQSLMVHYSGDQTSYVNAFMALGEINPSLAQVSMNLIPGEMTIGTTPSMASDLLISAKIPSAPKYKIKDSYAEKLLAYKDIIEVDYTANYIESDFLARVFLDSRNTAYVHYLIEPSRLSFEQYENRFTANLEIDGNITDENGRFVYQFERRIPIEMNSRQIASIHDKLFSYQDIFPVVPGTYKLSVILKNTVSKEFTTIDTPITVPEPKTVWMSPLLLANRTDRNTKFTGQVKPFLFGGAQLRPSPRNDFLQTDTLTVSLQLRGLTPELRSGGTLELAFVREGEKRQALTRKLGELFTLDEIIEEIPLTGFSPAYYTLEATLFDMSQKPVVSEKAQFFITPLASISRPWVLSMPFVSPDSPEIANILGIQLLNKKAIDGALPLLESSYRRAPSESKFALDLARAYFEKKDFDRVKAIVKPFIDHQKESTFILLMGQSCQALGETADALSFYKTYLMRFGTNISVLNSLGDCHLALGQKEEALTAYEKSLEIEPNQEKIKALIRTLKEKK
jgi:GWxTD domain-containing protein